MALHSVVAPYFVCAKSLPAIPAQSHTITALQLPEIFFTLYIQQVIMISRKSSTRIKHENTKMKSAKYKVSKHKLTFFPAFSQTRRTVLARRSGNVHDLTARYPRELVSWQYSRVSSSREFKIFLHTRSRLRLQYKTTLCSAHTVFAVFWKQVKNSLVQINFKLNREKPYENLYNLLLVVKKIGWCRHLCWFQRNW